MRISMLLTCAIICSGIFAFASAVASEPFLEEPGHNQQELDAYARKMHYAHNPNVLRPEQILAFLAAYEDLKEGHNVRSDVGELTDYLIAVEEQEGGFIVKFLTRYMKNPFPRGITETHYRYYVPREVTAFRYYIGKDDYSIYSREVIVY